MVATKYIIQILTETNLAWEFLATIHYIHLDTAGSKGTIEVISELAL